MFLFTVVVRHPKTSNNYSHVCKLLARTLKSVINQQSSDFIVVVACNKTPEERVRDERIIYKEVDFTIPNTRSEMLLDKGAKRVVAFREGLKRGGINFMMMLDADDLVSNRFLSTVNKCLDAEDSGARFNRGYLLDFNNQRLQRKYGLNHYCGSTLVFNINHILKAFKINKAELLSLDKQSDILDKCDNFLLIELLGNHRYPRTYFKNIKQPLVEINKPLVTWVVNNGENLSKTTIGKGATSITKDYIDEFSLDDEIAPNKASMQEKLYEQFRFLKSKLAHKFREYSK